MAKGNFSRAVNVIAFVGLFLVAAALIIGKILGLVGVSVTAVNAMRTIGECIAYVITAVSAFFFVRSKRNIWWTVAYAIAVIAIVVFVILG